jgi:hypothetical protein
MGNNGRGSARIRGVIGLFRAFGAVVGGVGDDLSVAVDDEVDRGSSVEQEVVVEQVVLFLTGFGCGGYLVFVLFLYFRHEFSL